MFTTLSELNAAIEERVREINHDIRRADDTTLSGLALPTSATRQSASSRSWCWAVRSFETAGVSDINGKCTGSQLGAGTGSSHWVNGGGGAVDFYFLGGSTLTGTDPQSIRLISMLDPVMPQEARVGQSNCRTAAGISLALRNLGEFEDSCNHLHIDIAFAKGPLNVGG